MQVSSIQAQAQANQPHSISDLLQALSSISSRNGATGSATTSFNQILSQINQAKIGPGQTAPPAPSHSGFKTSLSALLGQII